MELLDFFDKVDDSDIEGVGIGDGVYVRHAGVITKLSIEAIEENDWSLLYDVITGKREASVLKHMSRVVGYFSRIDNWNQSKIGELKDRGRGNYSV